MIIPSREARLWETKIISLWGSFILSGENTQHLKILVGAQERLVGTVHKTHWDIQWNYRMFHEEKL